MILRSLLEKHQNIASESRNGVGGTKALLEFKPWSYMKENQKGHSLSMKMAAKENVKMWRENKARELPNDNGVLVLVW